MIKTTATAERCSACGLWIPGHEYIVWTAYHKRVYADIKCRELITAAGDDGYKTANGMLYPRRWRAEDAKRVIIAMRDDNKSWQRIATALNMHPNSVRALGVSYGLPINLPGQFTNGGGWGVYWARLAQRRLAA